MLQDEGYCHQAITDARVFMQGTVEHPFGFQASGERRKLIHQGEIVEWVGFCGTIARTDLADADAFHAEAQRPRDHGMACFVQSHRPQVVVGANFHGGYQDRARSLPPGSLPQINGGGFPYDQRRRTITGKSSTAASVILSCGVPPTQRVPVHLNFQHGLKNL
jgi:hypothetical protein